MKKIRGKPKAKKAKATNGKRRTVKAANQSLQQFDERLSQIEQDLELNRRGLLALEAKVSPTTTEPANG